MTSDRVVLGSALIGVVPVLVAAVVAWLGQPLWWPGPLAAALALAALWPAAAKWLRPARPMAPEAAAPEQTPGSHNQALVQRLRGQVGALRALAELDRLIVEQPRLDDALRLILGRVPQVLDCHMAAVLVPRVEQSDEAWVHGQFYGADGGPSPEETLPWFAEEWSGLLDQPQGVTVHCDRLPPAYLASLPLPAPHMFHLVPVTVEGTLAALLILGFDEDRPFASDEASRARELADRVAVALKAEARDRGGHQRSHYDRLTGLPNRDLLKDLLDWELRYARREQLLVAFLYLDLDGFRDINARYGHGVGDELLRQVAERLRDCVREADVVARLGGDEFMIAASRLHRPQDAALLANAVREALTEGFLCGRHSCRINVSVGVSLYPDDGDGVDELISRADTAMYRAKQQGRGRFLYYTPDMNQELQRRLQLQGELGQALEADDLQLHYQPRFALADGRLVGAEALLRWNHPERGWVPCEEFLPVAEEGGMLDLLDEWVLRAAVEQIADWDRRGEGPEQVAVRLTAHQLGQPGFPRALQQLVGEQRVDRARLQLEVREEVLLSEEPAVRENLRELRTLGVGLCVNDFGAGSSCLSYLRRVPLQAVKVDRALVAESEQQDVRAMILSLIALAHHLDIEVIAEGIEKAEQLQWLRQAGCDAGYGYLLGRPVSAGEFPRRFGAGLRRA